MSRRQEPQGNETTNFFSPIASSRSDTVWRFLAAAGVIGAVAFVIYWPALQGGFILDDDMYLTEAPLIHASNGWYRLWSLNEAIDLYPISNTSLWLEWRLWGMNPTGYRVTNVLIHVATSLLVWQVLCRLAIPGAFFAALLFAVHPVNVESVAWIAQRKDLLAVLFLLLAILWYVRDEGTVVPSSQNVTVAGGDTNYGRWYWLSLVAFVLALLSKGSVASAPALLLVIDWWRCGKIMRKNVLRTVPFWGVAAAAAVVNIWCQNRVTTIPFRSVTERLLGAATAVWFYLSKAIVPIELSFVYPQWHIRTQVAVWWLPLAAAGILTFLLWHRRNLSEWLRSILAGWMFFWIALVPMLGFTDVGFMQYSLVADHYQHVALIAVAAGCAAAVAFWRNRSLRFGRPLANCAAVAIFCALALLSFRQSLLFADPITLYSDTLQKNPTLAMAHNNLGMALLQRGEYEGAISHLRNALEVDDKSVEFRSNLGVALAKVQRVPEAIEQFQQAIKLNPDYPEAHFNLALVLDALGRRQEAINQFEEAIRLRPEYADAQNGLGIALARQGRLQDAIRHLQTAVELNPNDPQSLNNLGVVLGQLGKVEEAIEHYSQAVRYQPDFIDAHMNLGDALLRANGISEAIEQFRQVLQIDSQYFEAYEKLGAVYAASNRLPEAVAAVQAGLDVARTAGRAEQVKRFQNLLDTYRHRSKQAN